MNLNSQRHLFVYFLVVDTYTCVKGKFRSQVVNFTISADILITKFMLKIQSENETFFLI